MEITERAARDVRDFYQQPIQVSAAPAAVADTLVLRIDATGVNVIDADLRGRTRADRPTSPRPPPAQLARRDRRGRSRMAVVTAVYDAAPAPRTTADIHRGVQSTDPGRVRRGPGRDGSRGDPAPGSLNLPASSARTPA